MLDRHKENGCKEYRNVGGRKLDEVAGERLFLGNSYADDKEGR